MSRICGVGAQRSRISEILPLLPPIPACATRRPPLGPNVRPRGLNRLSAITVNGLSALGVAASARARTIRVPARLNIPSSVGFVGRSEAHPYARSNAPSMKLGEIVARLQSARRDTCFSRLRAKLSRLSSPGGLDYLGKQSERI